MSFLTIRRGHALICQSSCLAYHTIPYQSYLWLAASLWVTTHDEERVLLLLRQAATRFDSAGDPWSVFQSLPEFANAPCWSEFAAMSAGVPEKRPRIDGSMLLSKDDLS